MNKPLMSADDKKAYTVALAAAMKYYSNSDSLVAALQQIVKDGNGTAENFYNLIRDKGDLKVHESSYSLNTDFEPFLHTASKYNTPSFSEAPAIPASEASRRAACDDYTLACFEAERNFKNAGAILAGLQALFDRGVKDIATYRSYMRQVGIPLVPGEYFQGTLTGSDAAVKKLITDFTENPEDNPFASIAVGPAVFRR